jgi:hypothetical protein
MAFVLWLICHQQLYFLQLKSIMHNSRKRKSEIITFDTKDYIRECNILYTGRPSLYPQIVWETPLAGNCIILKRIEILRLCITGNIIQTCSRWSQVYTKQVPQRNLIKDCNNCNNILKHSWFKITQQSYPGSYKYGLFISQNTTSFYILKHSWFEITQQSYPGS